MANGNLEACLAVTLPHEGGYVDHPRDPGGATNMGITFAALQKYTGRKITKQDVKNLSLSTAKQIYDKDYWTPMRCELLPWGVDLSTFDFGVNSGIGRAPKYLQRAVGVSDDGRVGPSTLAAVANQDPRQTIKKLNAARLGFVRGLSTFEVFGKGWSRRIADVEAKSMAMWLRYGAGMSAGKAAGELAAEADAAGSKSSGQAKGAVVGGAGGAAAPASDAVTSGSMTWLLALGAVLVIGAVILIVKSRQNSARAEAYRVAVEGQELDALAGQ